MLMRSIVAALDWNSNIDRAYKVSASGEQLFKPKVCCDIGFQYSFLSKQARFETHRNVSS